MIWTTVVATPCDIGWRVVVNALGKAQKHDLSRVIAHADGKFSTHVCETYALSFEHCTQTSTPPMSFDSTRSRMRESWLE